MMSLTAYSREPLASITSRIRDAVNETTDTPTDFTANVLNNEILLKPMSGLVDDDWSIAINHGSGNDGTIAYELSRPNSCLLYTSPSPRDRQKSRMPSSA